MLAALPSYHWGRTQAVGGSVQPPGGWVADSALIGSTSVELKACRREELHAPPRLDLGEYHLPGDRFIVPLRPNSNKSRLSARRDERGR